MNRPYDRGPEIITNPDLAKVLISDIRGIRHDLQDFLHEYVEKSRSRYVVGYPQDLQRHDELRASILEKNENVHTWISDFELVPPHQYDNRVEFSRFPVTKMPEGLMDNLHRFCKSHNREFKELVLSPVLTLMRPKTLELWRSNDKSWNEHIEWLKQHYADTEMVFANVISMLEKDLKDIDR